MIPSGLTAYLDRTAAGHGERVAVVGSDGQRITYAELHEQSNALGHYLRACGVEAGDRVGIALPKTIAAVIALFGVMKAGAAYVPVDHSAPIDRARRIFSDCRIKAAIVSSSCERFVTAFEGGLEPANVIRVGESDTSPGWGFEPQLPTNGSPPHIPLSGDDLAYVLYTSGSTGTPKGVMITHQNAVSFVEWSSSVFAPVPEDRFSSHAPFHFDLSILDIYLCIKHGASLHLISEELGKNPKELAKFIETRQISVWYSTPSILTLLMQFGNLEGKDFSSLRLMLFAGEVFPVKHLRRLKGLLPHPAYFNLYGPTETNVCTFARIPPAIAEERTTPYPIGFPCSHCASMVLDSDGREVDPGGEGLLFISGDSVCPGYWNQAPDKPSPFVTRQGTRWYNTGDIVRWEADEGFIYVGRHDRMVKRRGYRIELGEIERALYSNTRVREAAVVASTDSDGGVQITAFVACDGGDHPSIIELKTFCKATLPAYMSPDRFVFRTQLPKTSTDKTDYQALKACLPPAGVPTPS